MVYDTTEEIIIKNRETNLLFYTALQPVDEVNFQP